MVLNLLLNRDPHLQTPRRQLLICRDQLLIHIRRHFQMVRPKLIHLRNHHEIHEVLLLKRRLHLKQRLQMVLIKVQQYLQMVTQRLKQPPGRNHNRQLHRFPNIKIKIIQHLPPQHIIPKINRLNRIPKYRVEKIDIMLNQLLPKILHAVFHLIFQLLIFRVQFLRILDQSVERVVLIFLKLSLRLQKLLRHHLVHNQLTHPRNHLNLKHIPHVRHPSINKIPPTSNYSRRTPKTAC